MEQEKKKPQRSPKRLVEREKLRLGYNPNNGRVFVGEIDATNEDGGLDPRKSADVTKDFFRIVFVLTKIAEAQEKREATPVENPTEVVESRILLPNGNPRKGVIGG